jgi:hypothetical protein
MHSYFRCGHAGFGKARRGVAGRGEVRMHLYFRHGSVRLGSARFGEVWSVRVR